VTVLAAVLGTLSLLAPVRPPSAPPVPPAPLHLETYVADSTAFDVTSTIIYGPTEAILVDAQFRVSDANRVADLIAARGVTLKAVILTHPHDDHYIGAAVFRQRFPGVPVYISAGGLKEFRRSAPRFFAALRGAFPRETPDSLVEPQVFPGAHFTVDGEDVEVVPDLTGDEWVPSNSYVWIPSLRAMIAGDLVFRGVHVWLANSNAESRQRWLRALDQLEARHPLIVIAGHKRDAGLPDSPDVIDATRSYIREFDRTLALATGSDDLAERMRSRFPDLALSALILARSAHMAIPD
jgi:glyoxylase-like metal-dependent hydrolase (beta-lactamase superfamily II)